MNVKISIKEEELSVGISRGKCHFIGLINANANNTTEHRHNKYTYIDSIFI